MYTVVYICNQQKSLISPHVKICTQLTERCIFGSSPWDFLSAFLEVPNGMFYILEVPHIIFGNFGSFSSDFVHFWKLLLGCCVFMEVPHGNCCILEDSYGILCNFGSSS